MTTDIVKTDDKPVSILDGPAQTVKRRLFVKDQWLKGRSWTEITQDLIDSPDHAQYSEDGQSISIATLNTDIKVIRADLRHQLEEQGETHAALAIARMEQVQAWAWAAIKANEGDVEAVGFDPVKYASLIVKAQDSINRVTGVSSDTSGILIKPKDLKMYTFIDMLPDADGSIQLKRHTDRTIDGEFRDLTDDVDEDKELDNQPLKFGPDDLE